jgi:hypothetical protein
LLYKKNLYLCRSINQKTKKMSYKEYSKLSKELSALNEYKHKNGTNPKIEKRLEQIVKLIMPYAF